MSDDGVTWATIYSTSAGHGGVEDLTGLSGVGRFVRMQGVQRATGYGYSLWDIALYGTPASSSQPPTVVSPVAAGSTTATTAALSVLGADDGGEANLSYTWSVAAAPAGAAPVTFSANGSNAAKNTTATFTQPGTYVLLATIQDASGLTTTSAVSVNIYGPNLALNKPASASSVENGQPAVKSSLLMVSALLQT